MLSTIDRPRTRLSFSLVSVAVGTFAIVWARPVAAQTDYLVGAELYSSSSSGASVNEGYSYDTDASNSGSYVLSLSFNGTTYGKGIAIPLSSGANNFSIVTAPAYQVDPLAYAGIELFFASSPTPYNPTSSASTSNADLIVAAAVAAPDASGNFTPASGTTVEGYYYSSYATANGLTSYILGPTSLSESNLFVSHTATGSFTITESAFAPEPTTIAFAALGLGSSGLFALRRGPRR